jgi:type VI protein secretion system component VasK
MKILPFLAELELENFWPPQTMSPSTRECVLVLGSIFLMALAIVLWTVFFHRDRQHHHSRGEHQRHSSMQEAKATLAEVSRHLERRHHGHRRRRKHRPRNPSLAETRGLPPSRAEDPLNPLSQ